MDAKGFELLMAAKILGKGGGSPTPPEPPADGKTRLYISLAEGRLSPVLGLGVNGSVDVDWGDGTAHGTLTGTSTSTLVTIPHTYAQSGDYVITLTAAEGTTMAVLGSSSGSSSGSLLFTKNGTADSNSRVYLAALKKAYLGDSVTNIGNYAFYNCYSLTSITIPDSVTSIRDNTFNGCYGLTSITIPDSVTSIGGSVFYNCYGLTSITIPDSVTSIGGYTFNGCYGLTSITIPDSVTNIGSYAFNGCYSLTSITIPDSVTSIRDNAFNGCYGLTSITIPDSVTSIGGYTFNGCYGLGFIKFSSTTPPTIGSSNTFANVPTDCIIYVPEGTIEAYTSATNYPDDSVYTYVEY